MIIYRKEKINKIQVPFSISMEAKEMNSDMIKNGIRMSDLIDKFIRDIYLEKFKK